MKLENRPISISGNPIEIVGEEDLYIWYQSVDIAERKHTEEGIFRVFLPEMPKYLPKFNEPIIYNDNFVLAIDWDEITTTNPESDWDGERYWAEDEDPPGDLTIFRAFELTFSVLNVSPEEFEVLLREFVDNYNKPKTIIVFEELEEEIEY